MALVFPDPLNNFNTLFSLALLIECYTPSPRHLAGRGTACIVVTYAHCGTWADASLSDTLVPLDPSTQSNSLSFPLEVVVHGPQN